jgi:hypothetical protein
VALALGGEHAEGHKVNNMMMCGRPSWADLSTSSSKFLLLLYCNLTSFSAMTFVFSIEDTI